MPSRCPTPARQQAEHRCRAQEDVVGQPGVPAVVLAAGEPLEETALGDEDVAIDVERLHLVDGTGGGQPAGRRGREAAAVRGRGVRPDLLLRRVDDVEVVEPAIDVSQERPDGGDVVAPAARSVDADLAERALARVVGRAPAPQHVLRIEDEQVAPADGEEARLRDLRVADLAARAQHGGRLLALEVHPVDGLGRAIDDVWGAVRPADQGVQVERLGALLRGEGEQLGGGDGHHAGQLVQPVDDLGPQRIDRPAH